MESMSVELPRSAFSRPERSRIFALPANEHVAFEYTRFMVPIPHGIFTKGVRDDLELRCFNCDGAFEKGKSYDEVSKFTYDVCLLRHESMTYPLEVLNKIRHLEVVFDSCKKLTSILRRIPDTLRTLECCPRVHVDNRDMIPAIGLLSGLNLVVLRDCATPEIIPEMLDKLANTKIKMSWHPGPSTDVVQKSSFRIR